MHRRENETKIPLKVIFCVVCLLGLFLATPNQLSAIFTISPDSVRNWRFWKYENLKVLDPWGDSDGDVRDLVAVYVKEEVDTLHFRLDLLDMRSDSSLNVYFAIDYKSGGNTELVKGRQDFVSDITWDLLFVMYDSSKQALFRNNYAEYPEYLTNVVLDNQLDFVELSILKTAFTGWNGTPFKVQALVSKSDSTSASDKTATVLTDATTGRAKLIFLVGNTFGSWGPGAIGWYDGFSLDSGKHPGQRRGLKYLLDGVEKYKQPLTFSDLRVDALPGNDFLRINDHLRNLANKNLLDLLHTLTYGYFIPWQPIEIDTLAIRMSEKYRQAFDFPRSEVFAAYESMMTVGDLESIKKAGYTSALAGEYGYMFGWVKDWSNPQEYLEKINSERKIHLANGLTLFFDNSRDMGGGVLWDPRWGDLSGIWPSEYEKFTGTDNGFHLWWRRILLDVALDPDQEKYFSISNDFLLTPWMFTDIVERNFRWLACHPWIEVTTFSDLLKRNWTPIDHGDLGLAPDQLLQRYPAEGDINYNTYFSQFYYGGISDGHSPLIPQGTKIDGYFDYIPYLRNGQPIPSGRKMGDDKTSGTIIYETLRNLRSAPNNSLTRLAYLAYFTNVAEQTFHTQTNYKSGENPKNDGGGQYLHPVSKVRANHLRQVNKIVAAAQWADEAAKGRLPDSTQVIRQDLDLDGEDEYVMKNNKVFAVFENDAGSLEYAFAYDPSVGPVQLVAPLHQFSISANYSFYYEEGEAPWRDLPFYECAFEDTDWGKGGEYRFSIYSVVLDGGRLTFVSPDNRIRKTLTLKGNTIFAHYVTNIQPYVVVGFGLPINPANMYSRDWSDKIVKVEFPEAVGWKVTDGGYVVVNLMNTQLNYAQSFTDSPAREEMKEKEDPSTYPSGHYYYYPYHGVTVFGSGEFDVSLTLSAELLTSVEQVGEEVPREYAIYQNYPNPFNPTTKIKFSIPSSENVQIKVYDFLGREIKSLLNEYKQTGTYEIEFNANNLTSGVYFYRIISGSYSETKKMILLR